MTKKTTTAAANVTPAPVSTVAALREELRVLSAAADDTVPQKEWITPEFISMVTSVGINLVTAASVVGWVDAHAAQELTKAVTALGVAIGALSANAAIIWRYLAGRQAVKVEAMRMKYQYMETVAIERMRSNAGW